MPKSSKANDSMLIPTMGIPQGWQCPVCRKVHAPHVNSCDCHERDEPAGAFPIWIIPQYIYPPCPPFDYRPTWANPPVITRTATMSSWSKRVA